MKRRIALLLALALSLSLEACSRKEKPAPDVQETQAATQKAPEQATDATQAPIQLNYDLIGPWHLDPGKNDLKAFENSLDLFPGYGEWGSSMEIRGNGEMSWYIGAEGWHGTYAVERDILHGVLTSDAEQSPQNWDFRITLLRK